MRTEPRFTKAAQQCIIDIGVDWRQDVRGLREGAWTPKTLRAYCLSGADDAYLQGWHDYCDALESFVAHAEEDVQRVLSLRERAK